MKTVLAVMLLAAMLLTPAHADRNLMVNGGFEQADPTNPSLPLGWTMSKSTDSKAPSSPNEDVIAEWMDRGRTGKCVSLYTANTQVIGTWDSSQFEVKPNHKYMLRFFYRVDAAGIGPGDVAIIDGAGKRLYDVYIGEPTIWAQYEYVFETNETRSISVEFMLYHRIRQRYYFDDLELVDIGNAPAIRSPRDKGVLTSARPTIAWDAPGDQKVFTLQYSSEPMFKAGTTVTLKGIKSREYAFAKPLTDGTWFMRVVGVDAAGEIHTSQVISLVINRSSAGKGRKMDTTPPIIWGYSPVMDSREASPPNEVAFQCEDQGGSGIATTSAKMWIDGRAVPVEYAEGQGRVVHRPKSPLAAGRHIVTAYISDKAGNSSGKMTWGFFVQSDQPDVVSIDSNKNLVVNGRPFYMIGIYAHSFTDRQRVVPLMSKSGINTFWGGSNEENYRNSMKTLENIHFRDPLPTIEQDLKASLQDQMKRSVLLLYTTDEPDGSGISLEQLLKIGDTVHTLDPNHPTGWIITMPDNYAAYAKCSDILIEDHYPVLKSSGIVPPPNYLGVGRAVDLQNAAGGGKKPVHSVIQAFDSFADAGGKVSYDEHRPTGDEVLLMSYVAAMHGAKGLLLYPAGDAVILEDLMGVASKLRSLSPAFLAPPLAGAVKVGPGTGVIEAAARPGENGNIIVISVNPTQSPALAGFTMGRSIKEVRVLFEDRTVTPDGRRFSDIFQPASTHVYEVRF